MAILREAYGFVPGVFRAQGILPHLVEAEAALADAILFQDSGLSRIEKESIVLAEAAAEVNLYCVALQFQTLSLLGVPKQRLNELVGPHQIELSPTLESCMSLAWASFACTLAMGLGTSPDFPPPPMPTRPDWATLAKEIPISKPAASDDAIGLAFFRKQLGFVPNLFRLQASLPEALEAEAKVMAAILSQHDLLPPQLKEMLMLAASGSNRNDYGTALWGKLLSKRGISLEISDHSPRDQALFDFARKLGARTGDFNREDIQQLKEDGFADSHIVEAIATAAFANFLNTLQICLRAEPDFAMPELVWAGLPKIMRILYHKRPVPRMNASLSIPIGRSYRLSEMGTPMPLSNLLNATAVESTGRWPEFWETQRTRETPCRTLFLKRSNISTSSSRIEP